jgi:hypothetical protein
MLSNFELNHLCHHYSVPLNGIYLRDELPNGGPRQGITIINLDDSKPDMPFGTHWTALWCDGSGECFYFDSFGALPPPEAIRWTKNKGKMRYNAWICQAVKSETCGWFCLAFGIFMSREKRKGESSADCFNRFVNMFEDDTSKNDKHLSDYIKK